MDERADDIVSSGSDRPPRRWVMPLLAVLALLGIAAYLLTRGPGTPSATPTPPPGPTPSSTLGPTACGVDPAGRARAADPTVAAGVDTPVVSRAGGRLWGVRDGWELFGLSALSVVRIEPAAGRITVTPLPKLASMGPVTLLAAPGRAIVRPLDPVAGYAVPDGKAATGLSGDLAREGPVVPGPDPRHVWVQRDRAAAALVGIDGKPTGTCLALGTDEGFIEPDGSGGLLVRRKDGVWDLGHGRAARRLTTGDAVAIGSSDVLVRDCTPSGRCVLALVDPVTRTRTELRSVAPDEVGSGYGQISPDGRFAAVIASNDGRGEARLWLIPTGAGAIHRPALAVNSSTRTDQRLAWSPDSRWLFVVSDAGAVKRVDPETGQVRDLGIDLPPLFQIAVRPATH